MSVEEKDLGEYRGCRMYYHPGTETYYTPCFTGEWDNLAKLKEMIDLIEYGERKAEEERYAETYRGCEIYYYPESEVYGSSCVPKLRANLASLKSRIDTVKEEVEEEVEKEEEIEREPKPVPTPFVCPYCGAAFATYAALARHMEICPSKPVEIEAPVTLEFKCPWCTAEFATEPELVAHMEVCPWKPPEPLPEDLVDEEIEEEVPEEEEVEVFEVPALPWYASWLKPIIEYIGLLSESVVNFFAPIFEPIGTIAANMIALPGNMVEGFVDSVGTMIGKGRDRGVRIAVDTVSEVAEGTPEWMKALQDNLEKLTTPILDQYLEAVDVSTYEKSEFTGEKAVETLNKMRIGVMGGAIANFVLHAVVESGSFGQFEFMRDLDPIVIDKLGLSALAERATMLPLEKSVLLPAEYEFNFRHPTVIPSPTDLIQMVIKEVIPLDEFKVMLRRQGFNEEWSQRIWDAHFIPPNFVQILQAYYRGVISREQLNALKILVDLDPRYNEIWDSLIEVIPPYSELTNMLVKEVIDLEEYTKYLQWHGYDPEWSKKIWDAHFIPPTLGDILTAWRRGLIDEARVDELMILVDLDPRFKEIFDTRKFVDPSITAARYMFEVQAIDAEGVKDIIDRAGYLETDAVAMTDFITRFQERRFQRRYLTALEMGVVKGAYTPEELTAEVLEAGYTEGVAEWMIKTSEVRKRIVGTPTVTPKARILTLGDLKKAYLRDTIDEDVFRRELGVRGYEIGDVDVLVELLSEDKIEAKEGRKIIALSTTQMLNAFRYEVISEDEVRIMLQARGLDTAEVETLLETKKRQWGVSPP